MTSSELRKRVSEAIIPENPITPLDEFQCAKLLNVSVYWLRSARKNGRGPEVIKMGGQIRYTQEAVKKFVHSGATERQHTKKDQQSD